MADIVPFHTRAERAAHNVVPMVPVKTPSPIHTLQYHRDNTLRHCRELVNEYKKTERWDAMCEEQMIQVVHLLEEIAARLTAVTGADHGTTNIG